MAFLSYSQDSIPAKVSVSEKKNLDFQEAFFKALSEKAINNYQKAILNLEKANELIPKNKAVLFELSKNYFNLNKPTEAIEFAQNALSLEPSNFWLLEHLVTIYKREKNFDDAIKTQQKIAENHPKEKQGLVFLYLQNNNVVDAKKTLFKLKEEKLLTARLRRILSNLENRNKKPSKKTAVKEVKNTNLVDRFEKDKSFKNLKTLLEKLNLEKSSKLENYSQEGINLFPAQPLVYLMNGRANNYKKNYKNALESLQNGLDFVIDNPKMEANFYTELATAYQGLGNIKEANKYRKKAEK